MDTPALTDPSSHTQLLLDKMTDAMKADVQKKLDDAPPGKATADRFTRQVAAARAARPAAAPSAAPEGAAAEEVETEDETTGAGAMMDTYELAEPVEILSKLDKAHGENPPFWSGIKDAKWSLRRDALKELQVRTLPDFASRDGIDPGTASGVALGLSTGVGVTDYCMPHGVTSHACSVRNCFA